MNLGPFSPKHKIVAAVAASLSAAAVAVVGLSVSLSAQTAPSGADLAQQYLAALKPAGAAISTAEAKLQKLPVTASVGQVKAIVAPLGPALTKIEALTTNTTSLTTPAGTGKGLESLGSPKIVAPDNCHNTYGTPASGATLQIGYTRYASGFQMGDQPWFCEKWVNYTWEVLYDSLNDHGRVRERH